MATLTWLPITSPIKPTLPHFSERSTKEVPSPTQKKASDETPHIAHRVLEGIAEVMVSHQADVFIGFAPPQQSVSASTLLEAPTHKKSIMVPRDKEFSIVNSRILDLLRDEEEDAPKPTAYALIKTLQLIRGAYDQMEIKFPRAAASVDDQGAVYLYWRNLNKRLQITVPGKPSEEIFLYHKDDAGYATERNISSERLAYWLDWLAHV